MQSNTPPLYVARRFVRTCLTLWGRVRTGADGSRRMATLATRDARGTTDHSNLHRVLGSPEPSRGLSLPCRQLPAREARPPQTWHLDRRLDQLAGRCTWVWQCPESC